MSYYDTILEKVSEIVGEAGEVKAVSEPSRQLYSIYVTFTYPWSDPIGIEDYYVRISELVGIEGDGRVRLSVERHVSDPSKQFAKITVIYKTFYKTNGAQA